MLSVTEAPPACPGAPGASDDPERSSRRARERALVI